MKRNIYIFFLLFVSLFLNGQTLTINVPNPPTVQAGVEFKVTISQTNPTSCSQSINFNIGSLVYTRGNLPIGASVDNNTPGTLIVQNLQNTTGGAQSQNFDLFFKFPAETTCNNATVTLSGVLSTPCINSTVTASKQISATASLLTSGNLNTSVTQINYEGTNNCYGKLLKFRVSASKSINTNNLTSCKISLNMPKCADRTNPMVYMYNSYDPVTSTDITFTTAGSISTLTWKITGAQLNEINRGGIATFDVYVKFLCNSGTCISNNFTMSSKLDVTTICGTTLSSNATNTNILFTGSNCSTGCSVPDKPRLIETTNGGICPTGCNQTGFLVRANLDIPPTHIITNKTELVVTIPSGVVIKHAFVLGIPPVLSPAVACNISYQAEYAGTWHTINTGLPVGNGADNLESLNVTRVKFTFCNVKPLLVKDITLNFNYNSVSPTATSISIPYTITFDSSTQPITSASITKNISCSSTYLFKSVYKNVIKNPDSASSLNFYPGDIITYRLSIENISSGQIPNILIEDLLNSNLTYKGDFKYSYVNKNSTPSFANAINNQIPSSLGLGLGTIITPAIGQNTPAISISGLTFPATCATPKVLTLEFDVQINENVYAGTQIPNTFSVKTNNTLLGNASTYFSINSIKKVSPTMFAKCQNSNEWTKNINVRNGEVIDFKIQFKNRGSVPVRLKELINLKPQVGDVYEFSQTSNTIPRLSDFKIKYACSTVTKLPNSAVANFRYSNDPVTMSIFNGTAPTWLTTCNSETTNWFDIEFPGTGELINPGNSVEIIYSGIVTGSNGQIAKNSFSFKATEEDVAIPFASEISNTVVITNNGQGCNPLPPCYDCSSFDLVKKSKYLVSAWVKEEDPLTPEKQFKAYSNSSIKISFTDVGGALITTNQIDPITGITIPGNPEFIPTGEIIDGWQRIIGEFLVPDNVDDMKLELMNKNTNGTISYFDDVRVLPSNGNMKSFVYDQKTQRLMAELDENNYSTFYEYDLEGGLIRIKKETEKGVFTIQETRSGNAKK